MLGAMAVAFTSCDTENNENNEIETPNARVQINAVLDGDTTGIYAVNQLRIVAEQTHTVSSTSLNPNRTFSMLLAETPENVLRTISDFMTENFTVSDANVRWAWSANGVQAFSTSDGSFNVADRVGTFWNELEVGQSDGEFAITREIYIYVDRNVTIVGEYEHEDLGFDEIWNVDLRAGWNRVFFSEGEDVIGEFEEFITESIPGLTWIFIQAPPSQGGASLMNTNLENAQDRVRERARETRERGIRKR